MRAAKGPTVGSISPFLDSRGAMHVLLDAALCFAQAVKNVDFAPRASNYRPLIRAYANKRNLVKVDDTWKEMVAAGITPSILDYQV